MEKNQKVSELNVKDFMTYQRLDSDLIDNEEDLFIKLCIKSAISCIKQSTNLTIEEIDKIDSLNMIALMIASDFYENRSVNISINTKTNKMMTSIISMNRNLE